MLMDKLTVFIALTGFAVLLQACILAAMYLAMRKSGERIEALVAEVKTKVLPTVAQAQELLCEIRPKLEVVAENLAESTTAMRAQVQRVDATINDVVDRARLQVIRADELLSRTLDRVEQTSDMVHKTVISPVRQLSGLMQGISVGLEFLFGGRGRRNGGSREERRPVPQDEMFI
jgi:chromatin segregation and condensation protein Rec8/ScpA/Scc1 (kleisin family)